jgi:hypothetical protein
MPRHFDWLVIEMIEVQLKTEMRELVESLDFQPVDFLIVGARALAWRGLPR